MKKIIKITSLIAFTFLMFSFNSVNPTEKKEPQLPGIQFFHGTLKEAKAKAKKENKLVFIDCFTTWCGPCKNMAKKTFVNKEVGEYFNKNFICMKIDMENGEGPTVAKNYTIEAYPTYLFINSKGELKHRELGFIDATRFIEVGKTANSK